jgi:enolase-phosphatase E1
MNTSKTIVTDIEGTTSALSFVADVLFPYARQHLDAFVEANPAALQDTTLERLHQAMARDEKYPPLKTIQGLIWKEGYETGVLKGHIFPDAAAALTRWHAAGISLYVYSSGSVLAQQLLFRHSVAGDLTPLFKGYFDTAIGHKQQPSSYKALAENIQVKPEDILFLSDNPAELQGATDAGWQVQGIKRVGEGAPTPPWQWVADFNALPF